MHFKARVAIGFNISKFKRELGRRTEVAQLYIRDIAASAGPRPVREWRGFQKIRLQSGESHEMVFNISGKELGDYDVKGNWLVEPGKSQLWISKDSVSGEPADFEILK